MTTRLQKTKNVLLFGATGYLGHYILNELIAKGYAVTVIARNPDKLDDLIKQNPKVKIIQAELNQTDRIKDCCVGIDTVISTVGITRQKDRFSYMDVDFQANMNLLEEAERNDVRKFIYISVLNGEKLRFTAICKAKELFVDVLKKSKLQYCIIRPNAFFADITTYFCMAKKGCIFLFGKGELKSNPISGEDLSIECVKALDSKKDEIIIGGPEIKTQKEIAELAFNALQKKVRIIFLPDWGRKATLKIGKLFLPKRKFGLIEFFLESIALDMTAPKYGKHTIKEFFESLAD